MRFHSPNMGWLGIATLLSAAGVNRAQAQVLADRATPEAAILALYTAISGPARQARDWARLRALFAPEGRLTRVGRTTAGAPTRRTWTVEEYIAGSDSAMRTSGYFERELGHTTTRFGAMAHVFSSYEARDPTGARPPRRGLNSVQLYEDDTGWHIQSVLWDIERAGTVWPPELAPPKDH